MIPFITILKIWTFLFFVLGSPLESLAQSMPYKILLSALYLNDFPVIKPKEVENDDYIFLDTRELKEYRISHIENSLYVGYDDFDLQRIEEISKDSPIILYCSIGVRSQEIGEKLKNAGFTQVYNLYGGIFQWVNEGFPVYDEQGKTNRVHAYSKMWGIWLNKGEKVYD